MIDLFKPSSGAGIIGAIRGASPLLQASPCATGAALRRGDDRPCLLRRSADRPTHCREFGADRIQVREWLPGGGGHRRTASATATARAENGTCQRTRIVDDTCPAPRDPMVPPALPDRSKSPPRSPPSACRLISKPIPYSPPCLRLILAWVSTEAVRTQSRVLILGSSLAKFMRTLGGLQQRRWP